MARKTQGTELYFLDPEDSSVQEVGCVTSFDGPSAGRDQIETTCLDSTAREYVSGMATPGEATFGINFDPSDDSHIRLYELWQSGETIPWALGWGDGTAVPGADTNGFDFPATRTFVFFDGYVANVPFNFAVNAVVASSVALQVSGFPQIVAKSA